MIESLQSVPIAVYTTVYPGTWPFWPAFLDSVAAQEDADFTLWVGVDGVDPAMVRRSLQRHPTIPFLLDTEGGKPVPIRLRVLREITRQHAAVVVVDADDVLYPSRVEAARRALEETDIAGCAMALIDDEGRPLGGIFGPPVVEGREGDEVVGLPYENVFGFSNSAFRSEALARWIDDVEGVEVLDWFLATRAWLHGARFGFDPIARMNYRQYGANTAGVLGPFTAERLRSDIPRVLNHYDVVRRSDLGGVIPARLDALMEIHQRLSTYWHQVQERPELLETHAQSLDFEGRVPMWWEWATAPVASTHTLIVTPITP